jgi:hypothetical protein
LETTQWACYSLLEEGQKGELKWDRVFFFPLVFVARVLHGMVGCCCVLLLLLLLLFHCRTPGHNFWHHPSPKNRSLVPMFRVGVLPVLVAQPFFCFSLSLFCSLLFSLSFSCLFWFCSLSSLLFCSLLFSSLSFLGVFSLSLSSLTAHLFSRLSVPTSLLCSFGLWCSAFQGCGRDRESVQGRHVGEQQISSIAHGC